MRLRTIRIDRLPGIQPGFVLDKIGPGLNLIVGPNASGKSSVCRAFRALLYREERPSGYVALEAEIEQDGLIWHLNRTGDELRSTAVRPDAGFAPLPEHRFLACYTIELETLLQAGDTERDLHGLVMREMAGGYDIDAVVQAAPFRLKSNHGRAGREQLRQAELQLEQARKQHTRNRQDEDRLHTIRHQRDAAVRAFDDLAFGRAALGLLDSRRALESADSLLADFPPEAEMTQLAARGHEFEKLAANRRSACEERDAHEQAAEHAWRRAEQTGLVGAKLDHALLEDQRLLLEQLREMHNRREQAATVLAESRAQMWAATEALGGKPGYLPDLRPESIHRIESALEAYRDKTSDLRVLAKERERLPAAVDASPNPETIRQARDALIAWCVAAGQRRGIGILIALLLVALSMVAAGVGALLLHPSIWGLAALLLFTVGVLIWEIEAGAAQRGAAMERLASTGIAGPQSWSSDAVQMRLATVDRDLRDAQMLLAAKARRGELDREHGALAAQLEKEASKLKKIAAALGFDPIQLNASFSQWLRRVEDFERARRAACVASDAYDAADEKARISSKSIGAFLKRNGAWAEDVAPSAAVFANRLDRLSHRIVVRDEALNDFNTEQDNADRAAARVQAIDRDLASLYRLVGLSPGDLTGLYGRRIQLEKWRDARDGKRDAEATLRIESERLKNAPEWLALVELDNEVVIRNRLDALERQAARRDELSEEIAGIDARIELASKQRRLEETRAGRQAAQDTLLGCLDEALYAAAGRFLLESVQAEHAAESRPEVMRRAAQWFARFTRHEFELELAQDKGGFAARDTRQGMVRRLDELSSGTRMQLLLAVRLAFALEAERGCVSLPIFLDEALTATDPERYQAVAEALTMLVEDGDRQVFYLSAQPHDELYWRGFGAAMPNVIDMRKVRRLPGGELEPPSLEIQPLPVIPTPPVNANAAEYAAQLHVPPIDPWSALGEIHVFHLLRDRLSLLFDLLTAGVERIGPLRSFLESPGSSALIEQADAEELKYRLAIVKSFIEAWREGRGRPIDQAVLEAAPDVTPIFVERLTPVALDLGGDARALLEAIRERTREEVKGFRADKLEAFRVWLLEQGFLDERPILEYPALGLRAISAVAPWIESGIIDTSSVLARVRELASGVMVQGKGLEDRASMRQVHTEITWHACAGDTLRDS